MNKQRKVLITTTYNEMGIIIDTKAEEVAPPEIIRCGDCRWFYTAGCAIEIVDESDRPLENDFCSWAERRQDG